MVGQIPDHHLGFCSNLTTHNALRRRSEPDDGLARARPPGGHRRASSGLPGDPGEGQGGCVFLEARRGLQLAGGNHVARKTFLPVERHRILGAGPRVRIVAGQTRQGLVLLIAGAASQLLEVSDRLVQIAGISGGIPSRVGRLSGVGTPSRCHQIDAQLFVIMHFSSVTYGRAPSWDPLARQSRNQN
jgi:hypothetical protein